MAWETPAAPWLLEAIEGQDRGRTWALSTGLVRVGRADGRLHEGNWILVSEPSVSADHALLRWDTGERRYFLEHRSQTNRTLLNGRPVELAVVSLGDRIQMGRLVMRVGEDAAAQRPAPKVEPAPPGKLRMGSQDAAQMFGQLACMLRAGLPLTRGVEAVARQGASSPQGRVAEHLLVDMLRGRALSAALQQLPRAFTTFHVASVLAGEQSGRLPDVLAELSACEERNVSLVRTVKGSLTYPLVVFVIGLALVGIVGTRIFSQIVPALEQQGEQLPLLTRLVAGVAQAVQHPLAWAVLLAVSGAALWIVAGSLRTPAGRLRFDRLLLRLPVVSALVRRMFMVRLCRAMGLLYGGGVPLLHALESAAACTTNSALRNATLGALDILEEGAPLEDALRATGVFPELVLGMVAVGEDSGQLAFFLKKLAEMYDVEVEESLRVMATLLEPIVMAAMGVIVAVVVIATLMPMYRLVG